MTRGATRLTAVAFALASLSFGPTGCGDHLPDAYGPNQEILVLADSADIGTIDRPLRDIFEHVVFTPQEEQVYGIQYGSIVDFDLHKRRTNLLITGVLGSGTPMDTLIAGLLNDRVKEAVEAGEAGVVWKRDVWAEDQLLLIVTGRDSAHLISNLRTYSDRLYSELEEARNERTGELIYRYGERKDVQQQLADAYGWTIRVPFGYKVLEAYPDSGFVSLVKEEPARWFFVYWEDGIAPEELTPDWCIQKRDEITERFFGGDRVTQSEVKIQEADFAGKLAVQLSGIWENQERWSGGPFKSYAFVDLQTERFFHVDVGIFAPNKRKEPYLRQVDLMAQSFTIMPDGRETATR